MNSGWYKRQLLPLILIILVGLMAYSNTLSAPFHFDDRANIAENPKVRNFSGFWPPSEARWFGLVTFALNYHFGGTNPFGYHLVNISVHIINAVLVYFLVLLTFKTAEGKEQRVYPPRRAESMKTTAESGERRAESQKLTAESHDSLFTFHHSRITNYESRFSYVALFSALLFVSHPVQTQAVTYIVQRFTSLATLFYLLSLVMYIKFRSGVRGQGSGIRGNRHEALGEDEQKVIGNRSEARYQGSEVRAQGQGLSNYSLFTIHYSRFTLHASRFTFYGLSLLSATLAMKTKEIAFTLPLVITLYEFTFFKGTALKRTFALAPLFLMLLIIPSGLQDIDRFMDHSLEDLGSLAGDEGGITRTDYLFTQFRVIVTYLRLLIFPINQNLDYDYPIYRSFSDPNVFLSFFFLLCLLGLGIYCLYRSRVIRPGGPAEVGESRVTSHVLRFASFSLFWFFITLSVESSIIPIRDVIFEHRIYLPSVGFLIAAASAVTAGIGNIRADHPVLRKMLWILPLSAVIILTAATLKRNFIWQTEVGLLEDTIRKSPHKGRAFTILGWYYLNEGNFGKAIHNFEEAETRPPVLQVLYPALVDAYDKAGEPEKAISAYYRAAAAGMKSAAMHRQIGKIFFRRLDLDNGEREFREALVLEPGNASTYYSLGLIYRARKDYDTAMSMLGQAISLDRENADYADSLEEVIELSKQK